MIPKWLDFILAGIAVLLLTGQMAYVMMGEDTCKSLMKSAVRFSRYVIEDVTDTSNRDNWE